MQKAYTLAEIATIIGAELQGDPNYQITGIAPLDKAKAGQVSFLVSSRYQMMASTRYQKYLAATKASAVVLHSDYKDRCQVNKLIMENPYQGYVKLASLFQKEFSFQKGIHSSVVLGERCQIDPSVHIGPNVVIGNDVIIGQDTVISANCVIGDDSHIGQRCHLWSNVTLYHGIKIGQRVVVHSGAVIGSDGFGMIRTEQGWKKIPHLGGVTIGDDVEIGANTTIDRGSLDDTVIENGVKLDNQIQVAHNVSIGANTVIAGCVGIGGSTHIGKNCMIGGAVGISDNLNIVDNVIFTGMSQITKSISEPGIYSSGTGILPYKDWQKQIVRLHHLDELARRVRKLEKELNE